jgi:hypothetical protein
MFPPEPDGLLLEMEMPNKTGKGERKDRNNQQQSGGDRNKDEHSSRKQERKQSQDIPGNLGNDQKRGDAGRNGGRS